MFLKKINKIFIRKWGIIILFTLVFLPSIIFAYQEYAPFPPSDLNTYWDPIKEQYVPNGTLPPNTTASPSNTADKTWTSEASCKADLYDYQSLCYCSHLMDVGCGTAAEIATACAWEDVKADEYCKTHSSSNSPTTKVSDDDIVLPPSTPPGSNSNTALPATIPSTGNTTVPGTETTNNLPADSALSDLVNNTPPTGPELSPGIPPNPVTNNPIKTVPGKNNPPGYKPIPVPVRNQNDPANGSLGPVACVPTALGSVAAGAGVDKPPSFWIDALGTNSSGTPFGNMVAVAQQNGFPNTQYYQPTLSNVWNNTFHDGSASYGAMTNAINNGNPVIVGVDLGNYADGHALVVTGISGDNVYVNNPWGNSQGTPSAGQNQVISITEFKAMWRSQGYGYVIPLK